MNNNNLKSIVITTITFLFFILLMFRSCSNTQELAYTDTSNNDSLRYYKSKYAQAVYWVEMRDKDLREASKGKDSLSKVIKELEKKTKSSTIALARARANVIYDTIRELDTVYTVPPREIELAIGFTDNNQAYITSEQLDVKSLSVSYDDDALARKYKDRYKWGVGVTAGCGISGGVNGFSIGPSITIGLHRSIVTFGRRKRH